jgi:hypothetical protein
MGIKVTFFDFSAERIDDEAGRVTDWVMGDLKTFYKKGERDLLAWGE